MTDEEPVKVPLPEIGSTVTMPVFQSATRTTLFADSAVVASAESGDAEIVFLRRELVSIGQQGEVTKHESGDATIQVTGFQFQTVTHDIGHVRMNVNGVLDLAVSILAHAGKAFGTTADEIAERLRTAGITTK